MTSVPGLSVMHVPLNVERFGRSLRDPNDTGERSIDLPELRNFAAWAKLPLLDDVIVWVPLESHRDQVQVAQAPDRALIAVAYGSGIACVDLRSREVTRVVRFLGGEVTDMVPATGRTVLVLYQTGVAEVSLSDGLLWKRCAPDHIADYRVEGEVVVLTLESGQALPIDLPHERTLAVGDPAEPDVGRDCV